MIPQQIPNISMSNMRNPCEWVFFFLNYSIVLQPFDWKQVSSWPGGQMFSCHKISWAVLSVTLICHTSPNSTPLACQTWETVFFNSSNVVKLLPEFNGIESFFLLKSYSYEVRWYLFDISPIVVLWPNFQSSSST